MGVSLGLATRFQQSSKEARRKGIEECPWFAVLLLLLPLCHGTAVSSLLASFAVYVAQNTTVLPESNTDPTITTSGNYEVYSVIIQG